MQSLMIELSFRDFYDGLAAVIFSDFIFLIARKGRYTHKTNPLEQFRLN